MNDTRVYVDGFGVTEVEGKLLKFRVLDLTPGASRIVGLFADAEDARAVGAAYAGRIGAGVKVLKSAAA